MKRILGIFLCFSSSLLVHAQNAESDDYAIWSSQCKLTIDDFGIKSSELIKGSRSFAQFSISFKVGGFDFMARNFNKKVSNQIIKAASWIDTTMDVEHSLRYQQTLFDLAEIYARRFRKELKENKRKIATGTDFVSKLNADIMASFASRRLEYEADLSHGEESVAQAVWEALIKRELKELAAFAAAE